MTIRKSGHVLVVDDKSSWRKLLTAALEAGDHKVTCASSFHEGQQLLESDRFDLAIIDMRLVDSSVYNVQGMALLGIAKRLHPLMKAVILTGYPDPDQKARALDHYGADRYLEKAPEGKSIDIDAFNQLITDLLLG